MKKFFGLFFAAVVLALGIKAYAEIVTLNDSSINTFYSVDLVDGEEVGARSYLTRVLDFGQGDPLGSEAFYDQIGKPITESGGERTLLTGEPEITPEIWDTIKAQYTQTNRFIVYTP
jgi:hypothetical protein